MPSTLLARFVAVGWLALGAAAPAQAPDAAAPAPQRLGAVYLERLEVKLAEGSGAELVGGRLVSRTGVDLSAVGRWFAEADVRPLVYSVPREVLDRWHAHACAVLPEHNRPGHLGLWFKLTARDPASAERLRAALVDEPLVEHVYHEPVLYPATCGGGDLPPTTPSFVSQQLSHAPSPLGHGVRDVGVDHAFTQTFGLDIAAGRDWSREIATDLDEAFLINETAARAFGWADPSEAVGKRLARSGQQGVVVGRVEHAGLEVDARAVFLLHVVAERAVQGVAVDLRSHGADLAPQGLGHIGAAQQKHCPGTTGCTWWIFPAMAPRAMKSWMTIFPGWPPESWNRCQMRPGWVGPWAG